MPAHDRSANPSSWRREGPAESGTSRASLSPVVRFFVAALRAVHEFAHRAGRGRDQWNDARVVHARRPDDTDRPSGLSPCRVSRPNDRKLATSQVADLSADDDVSALVLHREVEQADEL